MKKIAMAAVAALFAVSAANAQTSAGTILVGGSLGFNTESKSTTTGSTETKDYKSTNFNILATGGYFIADKTAVGLNIGYNSSKNIQYLVNNNKTTTTYAPITIGVFAQRYFMFNDQFGLLGNFNVTTAMGTEKRESVVNNVTTTTKFGRNGLNFGLSGGAIWFPTQHVGISANVGFLSYYINNTKTKDVNPESKEKVSGFNFDLSSSTINLGFSYFIF